MLHNSSVNLGQVGIRNLLMLIVWMLSIFKCHWINELRKQLLRKTACRQCLASKLYLYECYLHYHLQTTKDYRTKEIGESTNQKVD